MLNIPAQSASRFMLYDDFRRYPSSSVLSGKLPKLGRAWGTTGAVTPTTSSGRLVCTSTGTGYLFNTVSGTPRQLAAELSWTGGSDLTQKGMTISYAAATQPFSLNDLFHLNFSPLGFTLTSRVAGGSFDVVLSDSWRTAMSNDSVMHKIALGLIGTKAVIARDDSEFWYAKSSLISSLCKGVLFWEPEIKADGLQVQVQKVYALRSVEMRDVNFTEFNASDKNSVLSLSNNNMTVSRSGGSSTPQARAVAPVRVGAFYFEVTLDLYGNPSSQTLGAGIASLGSHNIATTYLGQTNNSVGVWMANGNTQVYINGAATTIDTGTVNQGDTFGIAVDLVGNTIKARNITKGTDYNPSLSGAGVSISGLTNSPHAICFEIDTNGGRMSLNNGWAPYLGRAPSGFGYAA